MVPPSQNLNLDITAISGICGSISIACWVVVFSPQIVENFRRGSADGLSLQFIIVWLAGDVFNILGAVLQGVLPTMIILAVYYTIADIVLLCQCFYYRGFTWHDEVIPPKPAQQSSNVGEANERTGLLSPSIERERRDSAISASHLSPAMPLLDAPRASDPPAIANQKPTTRLQATLFNLVAVLMVCAAGILGWYVSNRSQGGQHHSKDPSSSDDVLSFNLWGQIFGYFCAVLYLGSRIPQLLLNYRRKSTEGISLLFFLFAVLGNLTYVLSIFAYEPHCHGKHGKCHPGEASGIYGRYIAVNASWLAGSLGTLFLDAAIFVQFFLYREEGEVEEESAIENGHAASNGNGRDQRPLLERGDSGYQ
ncbi:PQ-loop-domain-containing protein [Mollisia scopiformis]|uniref:PQ-loop-domain-containing protein n=1 Tax=Mollisia scopiformis TaxID=149040 RepID=A0A194XCB4_MOLSC|nr:PQ-loop-domain-containing protein [Mollisia scopiformis]KUJ17392.1 PQ-loop-domain-containing protein [Mollisia scopiformis]